LSFMGIPPDWFLLKKNGSHDLENGLELSNV
jgi:hypothetical protein